MSKKIITKIGKLNNSEIIDVSEIHFNSMRGVFSKLGIEFIRKYYQSVNKNGLFYCKKINGKVLGYCCWVYDTNKVNLSFLKSNFLFLMFYVLKNLFTYKTIILTKLFLFTTFRKNFHLPKSEFVAIAKMQQFNYPFTKNALIAMEKDLKKNKITKYFVCVNSKLTSVKKRYLKNKFKEVKKINSIYPCSYFVKQI